MLGEMWWEMEDKGSEREVASGGDLTGQAGQAGQKIEEQECWDGKLRAALKGKEQSGLQGRWLRYGDGGRRGTDAIKCLGYLPILTPASLRELPSLSGTRIAPPASSAVARVLNSFRASSAMLDVSPAIAQSSSANGELSPPLNDAARPCIISKQASK